MSKIARKIYIPAILLLLMQWIVGCSSRGDEPQSPWNGELYLSLRVYTPDRIKASRAENDNDYNFQLPTLDTEKINSLRVIIVKPGNGVAADTIVHNRLEPVSGVAQSMDGLRYKVDFATSYYVYLIANEEGLTGVDINQLFNVTLAQGRVYDNQIESLVLEASEPGKPLINNETATTNPVPMSEKYQVRTIARPTTSQETYVCTMEQDLFITRGASKFTFNFYKSEEFFDPDPNDPLEIKGIRIYGLGQSEYFLPTETEYDPPKYEPSTNEYGGRIITSFELPTDKNGIGDFDFIPNMTITVAELNEYKEDAIPVTYAPQLYFPESKGLSGDAHFQCSVTFDGETYVPPVELPNLQALPRNTHVVVNITVNPQTKALFATVRVLPYTGVNLNPIFGL